MEHSEKLGLGFQSDEAEYEKQLCDEIESLVLGKNRVDSEKSDDFDVGFGENDEKEDFYGKNDVGFDKNGVGFGGNGKKDVFDGKKDLDFGENGEKVVFDGKKDVGFGENSENCENVVFDGEINGAMSYDKEYVWGDDENDDINDYDEKEVIGSYYGGVTFDKEDEKEGFNSDWGFDEDERKGYVGNVSFDNVKEGFNVGKNNWADDSNNSYPPREEFYDGVGFGGARKGFDSGENSWGNNSYPVRPDAEDCQYYMRYGSCKFGPSCKFNHPLKRRNQYPKAAKDNEDYSERPGKVECKYNMTSGGCKFGTACKFNHSRANFSATPAVEFNFLGLPIRLGETECPYYMRTGSCKYGSNCRFNHPQPTTDGINSPSRYVNGGAVSSYPKPQTNMPSWSSRNAVNGNGSMSPYSPTNGVPNPNPEWNSYQAPGYPATERRLPNPPALALNNYTEPNFYANSKMPMTVDNFPERPGEPECSYFIKTGDCKYRSGCKFHHPKNRTPSSAACVLSDKGLPLRPDQQVCTYYTRYGICKFGPACRYDHPANYDNSASSPLPSQNTPRPVAARW